MVKRIVPKICWSEIETVLLDMDGTLLDKNFDDQFWEHHVPLKYGEKNGLNLAEAKKKLHPLYQQAAGSLDWTDIDYWARTFDLDIFELKYDLIHLISELPGTIDFLRFLTKMKKEVVLVTNSHPKGLALKFTRTEIEPFFTRTSCALEMKAAKEELIFWQRLHESLGFNKEKTLFIDDSQPVLEIAEQFGIKNLVTIASPSSTKAASYSNKYPSVNHVGELAE